VGDDGYIYTVLLKTEIRDEPPHVSVFKPAHVLVQPV
jgi:hypothetical protein